MAEPLPRYLQQDPMAYDAKYWDVVKAFYEEGLSLAEIIARPEVKNGDRSTISKKAKAEGWIKGKNSTLTTVEIQTKQNLAEIAEKKSTLNSTEREIHDVIVDERTKHIQFFNNATLKNVSLMMRKVTENTDIQEHRAVQATLRDGKEVVLGKGPDVAVQINNNALPANVDLSNLSNEELEAYIRLQEKAEAK